MIASSLDSLRFPLSQLLMSPSYGETTRLTSIGLCQTLQKGAPHQPRMIITMLIEMFTNDQQVLRQVYLISRVHLPKVLPEKDH